MQWYQSDRDNAPRGCPTIHFSVMNILHATHPGEARPYEMHPDFFIALRGAQDSFLITDQKLLMLTDNHSGSTSWSHHNLRAQNNQASKWCRLFLCDPNLKNRKETQNAWNSTPKRCTTRYSTSEPNVHPPSPSICLHPVRFESRSNRIYLCCCRC